MEIQMAAAAAGGAADTSAALPTGQAWWEGIARARARIVALVPILGPHHPSLSSLSHSDRPAQALLEDSSLSSSLSSALSLSSSGSGSDPLCHWLYDTFLTSDLDLILVVLSFVPLISGLYLSRSSSLSSSSSPRPNLAGFEAVLLALYSSEVKIRQGKPIKVNIPDLGLPSLYHAPRQAPAGSPRVPEQGVVSPPLEPQTAVKSTKRASIVGVALDLFYRKIAVMPMRSKLDLCNFAASWAGQNCPCCHQLDDLNVGSLQIAMENLDLQNHNNSEPSPSSPRSSSSSLSSRSVVQEEEDGPSAKIRVSLEENDHGQYPEIRAPPSREEGEEIRIREEARVSSEGRIPLPWELLQPVLRILGHCLLAPLNPQEVRDAASVAVRSLYARASHDLVPQAILATRSLIQLDKGARMAAQSAAMANASVNVGTPTKPKKPEIFLVSK
ncbi:hypothetical protein AMTRI_Chr04g250320 [Amborella trichopoda]|uniref:Hyccin n=1 Tax=Amborella trichopoda TaxID=13333 RepID=W1NZZ0_AMBTC|nr:uncharacterized protein LOC18429022 [Amborella trichopoda]ERN00949.1 hypothetical protein AMTR_s00002p00062280 [Amborella trichopoda]|eukprot:XP_006838380.1 uncharacterized protein LOC18429022 [Amborella trichopoda]